MAATTLAVAPDLGGPSPVRAALFEYRGQGHPGSIHVLRAGRNVLGRDAAVCDVVLDDDRASKQHAFLFIRGDEASFIDVSSNGSMVDGRSVFGTEAKLQQHSTVDIGATRLVFVIVPERLIDGPR
jgi:pSer/pThr/pTyr-binding forkhead associated (FHA) protein